PQRSCRKPGSGAVDDPAVDDAVAGLVDQSLLEVTEVPGPVGLRYHLLETVREVGAERLARDDDEHAMVARRFGAWAAGFATQALHRLLQGVEPDTVAVIEAEQENLIAALRGALTSSGRAEEVARTGPDGAVGPAPVGHASDAGDANNANSANNADTAHVSDEVDEGDETFAVAARVALPVLAVLGGFWTMRGAHAEAAAWVQRIRTRLGWHVSGTTDTAESVGAVPRWAMDPAIDVDALY